MNHELTADGRKLVRIPHDADAGDCIDVDRQDVDRLELGANTPHERWLGVDVCEAEQAFAQRSDARRRAVEADEE